MRSLVYGLLSVLFSVVILTGCRTREHTSIADIKKTSGFTQLTDSSEHAETKVTEEINISVTCSEKTDSRINQPMHIWFVIKNSGFFELICISGFLFVTFNLYLQNKRSNKSSLVLLS